MWNKSAEGEGGTTSETKDQREVLSAEAQLHSIPTKAPK